ncbi:MAG: hypothetical protein JWN11_420 [Hyphomicrobiales bacterium]|nr:hypothetical protein [Hyphomicrobiales bacterium]
MKPPQVYQRAFSDGLDNVVTVKIAIEAGVMVAEVIWPANAGTAAGDYFYPTHVPLALERAEDVRDNYGFRAVVVWIEDASLWDEQWGILVDLPSA